MALTHKFHQNFCLHVSSCSAQHASTIRRYILFCVQEQAEIAKDVPDDPKAQPDTQRYMFGHVDVHRCELRPWLVQVLSSCCMQATQVMLSAVTTMGDRMIWNITRDCTMFPAVGW